MELKETNHFPSSVEMNVVKPSEGNNSNKRSIYDMVFSAEEDVTDNSINSKQPDINNKERKFGNASTLDWLQTWRSTEISYDSSSDPGR
jgi:hypothetical protein